jgi:Na+-translocating ferredoxin:NAD+ oxidoreductase RnfD subunit
MKSLSIKTQLIIFLSVFALYLSFVDKDALFLVTTLVAVACAMAADSVIVFSKSKKFVLTESSVISGLIIGYVLSNTYPWWMFLCVSVFAICSKHLLRIREKHLFNPAAFGIFLATVLLGASTQWRGVGLWYILVPAGVYFVSKIQKMEVVIGYMAVFVLLFGTQAFFQKTSLLDVLIYQNFFFIFVMLIEPKTTPVTRKGKVVFGAAVAILVFILTAILTASRVKFEAELLSLLAVNAFSLLLNKLK